MNSKNNSNQSEHSTPLPKVPLSPTGELEGGQSRGIRNNNPLNIRHNPANRWVGMADKQTDPSFVQFKDMKWGIRAAFRILLNYVKNGINTPRKIITRWAPPKENNTEGYINSVAMLLNGERSMDEKVQTMMDYCLLARAMAWVETGRFLPFELFKQAWSLTSSPPNLPFSKGGILPLEEGESEGERSQVSRV